MPSILRRCALLGWVAIVAMLGLLARSAYAEGSDSHTIVVHSGESIQEAIDSAAPGSTIVVRAGVFKESLQITTDRITLRGSDGDQGKTVLEPPVTPADTPCKEMGGVSGVCVLGNLDARGGVVKPVTGVNIGNLTVQNFPDNGVIGFGTDKLSVTHVVALHNTAYGIARFISTRSRIAHNVARFSEEAGIYVGDSPKADTTVVDNLATGNGIGLFVRDSTDVTVEENRATGNCVGILALNTTHGAIAGGNYRLRDNQVTENNRPCRAGEGPASSGLGIALVGTHDVRVEENKVLRNKPTGETFAAAGIVVVSSKNPAMPAAGGADPVNNTVTENTALNNQPYDLLDDGSGSRNRFKENRCQTSRPPELCRQGGDS